MKHRGLQLFLLFQCAFLRQWGRRWQISRPVRFCFSPEPQRDCGMGGVYSLQIMCPFKSPGSFILQPSLAGNAASKAFKTLWNKKVSAHAGLGFHVSQGNANFKCVNGGLPVKWLGRLESQEIYNNELVTSSKTCENLLLPRATARIYRPPLLPTTYYYNII